MSRELEPLRPGERKQASLLLARAFRDNPASLAIIDAHDGDRRERVLVRAFRGFVEATARYGEATAVRDAGKLAGISLVFRPGQYPEPLAAFAWMALGPVSAGPLVAFRYGVAQALLSRWHPKERHWYLFVLGVDPAAQGKGHGGALLSRLNELADADALPCYLEADREDNVRLYERFGYRIEKEGVVRRAKNLRFWTMTRR